MQNVIEIKNLSKKYSDFELKDVNLNIPEGSIVGLIGQNGAGKTTLIKLILEIINKNNGEIKLFNGKKIEDAKEDIGVVLDQAFFPEVLQIKDLNIILKNVYKKWNQTLFDNYLKTFNLKTNQTIKSLSTGMRKKLEIACALSHNPKLLILDEPTSGLDPVVRCEILDLFKDFVVNEHNSILISSHITTDLENIADYIIFINKGEIVFDKDIEDINNYAILKCSESDFKKIDKKDIVRFRKNKYDYEILISDKNNLKKKYKDMVIDNAKIDDIMLFYVKGEQ